MIQKNNKPWNYGLKTGKLNKEHRLKISKALNKTSLLKRQKINKNIFDDDVIIGLLLSDAHLTRPRTEFQNSSFSISIGSKYKTFPNDVEEYLKSLNIHVYKKEFTRKTGVVHWNLKTPVDLQFTELRKIWYPDGIKIVPRDLKLTPRMTAWLFMGDGSSRYYVRGNKKVDISLQTQGFSLSDVLFLKYQLELLGVKMNVGVIKRKSIGYILRTKVSAEVEKFMSMVEPYILQDFQYKIKHPYVNSKTGIVPLWKTDSIRTKCDVIDCIHTAEKDRSKCRECFYHKII